MTRALLALALPLAVATLPLGGCGGKRLPTATIDVAGHAVTVELATDPETRARGLMHRDHLDDDEGMLFVYPTQEKRSFWMKNTRVPLSIAYIDRAGTIQRIADMTPHNTDGVPSLYPVMYALEVRQGWFADRGIERGAKVTGIPAQLDVK